MVRPIKTCFLRELQLVELQLSEIEQPQGQVKIRSSAKITVCMVFHHA